VEFAKETETLEVLGGWIDGNFFDASQIKTLSALPNKETLQAQLVGRLNGIIAGLAYSLNFPIQKLAFVVEAVKNAQPAAEVKVEEKPVAEDPKAEEPSESAETPTEESKEETKTEEVEVSDLSDGALAKSEEVKEEDK